MVILLDSLPRRVRYWYRLHVYRMYNFRTLFVQEQEAANPKEKKRLVQKREHLRKKVEQHMEYGKILGIDEVQMRQFNLAIIEEVKKKQPPNVIVETLIRENGRK